MLIAQISDTHIRPKGVLAMGRVDTAGYLARAVAHINALRPAPVVVLVTGDLVVAGMGEEYPEAWASGHRLRVLHRATPDTWEMHTLDGTPR